MDDLHIGYIDDDNYKFYGKLSDGTHVYKYSPPPPPDPSILRDEKEAKSKIIDDYNKSTEFSVTDTSGFLQLFNEQEEAENNKRLLAESKSKPTPSKPKPPVEDTHGVLEYLKQPENVDDPILDEKVDNYLDIFKKQEAKEREDIQRRVLLEEQAQQHIETECQRRNKSAQKYKNYLNKVEQSEREDLKRFEQIVLECENQLHDEYSKLLEVKQIPDFYDERVDYDVKTNVESKSVTVTNKDTNVERIFNYLGNLESTDIVGYKLRLYSIVKGDKEYGIIRESYNYLTHRHMVYDLRTGQSIKRETFIISKVDPTSINSEDPDVYTDGYSSYNQALSDPVVYNFTSSGTVTLSLSTGDISQIDPNSVISELVVELYGAGGAGANAGDVRTGGGGGAYVKKTFRTQDLIAVTGIDINIGSGLYTGVSSVQSHWDNQTIRPTKDSYAIVGSVTAAAGGGRDSIIGTPAFQGQPMLTYDVGYYGMGVQVNPYLSAANAFNLSDYTEMHPVGTFRWGGWGASLSGHGSKTNNIGASGGIPAAYHSFDFAGPGTWPGAGGAAAGGDPSYTSGASGADGFCKVTITRAIVNAV
jgi:hypothetical protein